MFTKVPKSRGMVPSPSFEDDVSNVPPASGTGEADNKGDPMEITEGDRTDESPMLTEDEPAGDVNELAVATKAEVSMGAHDRDPADSGGYRWMS